MDLSARDGDIEGYQFVSYMNAALQTLLGERCAITKTCGATKHHRYGPHPDLGSKDLLDVLPHATIVHIDTLHAMDE